MEVRVIARVKEGEPRPAGVPLHMLRDDEAWADAAELGVVGGVLDQDTENMELCQDGLKVSKNQRVELGDYQEVRIRHIHQTIDKYLAR